MKKKHLNVFIIILLVGVLAGFGSFALAGSQWDYGRSRWTTDQGNHEERFGRGRYHGARMTERHDALSDEDQKKIDAERRAFSEATKDLKRELHRKQLEIRAELVGKQTDAKKALALQKELSALRSELEMKRLEHWLRIKEIVPDAEPGLYAFSHKRRGDGWHEACGGCR